MKVAIVEKLLFNSFTVSQTIYFEDIEDTPQSKNALVEKIKTDVIARGFVFDDIAEYPDEAEFSKEISFIPQKYNNLYHYLDVSVFWNCR